MTRYTRGGIGAAQHVSAPPGTSASVAAVELDEDFGCLDVPLDHEAATRGEVTDGATWVGGPMHLHIAALSAARLRGAWVHPRAAMGP